MKKYYLLIPANLFFLTSQAQFVGFNDAELVTRLLDANEFNGTALDANGMSMVIDANNNGAIEISEAESVYALTIGTNESLPWPVLVHDLAGIEAFVNLRTLNCGWNNISLFNLTSMPNLEYLSVTRNPIAYIDAGGLTQLQVLQVTDCALTSINQINFEANALVQLELDRNNFDALDLSNFPLLSVLSLGSCNLNSVNFSNLPVLETLVLTVNELTALDVSGLPNLRWLHCYSNLITNIDVSQNSLLQTLSVSWNSLTNLDLSQNHSLYTLDAVSNNLTWLNIKNGLDEAEIQLQSNPNLAYICADESQITNPQFLVNTITEVNSYCSFSPGGTYNAVAGNVTFDNDSNGCDAEDIALPNVRFSVHDGNTAQTHIGNNSGNFNISLIDGAYTMTPMLENPGYFNISPSVSSFSFPELASPLAQNFCVTPNGMHTDLELVIMALNPSRPGFDTFFRIIYKNKGNHTQSGIINFSFDDAVFDLIASNPAVTSQMLNELTWNFDNLAPFEVRHIDLTLNLNSPTDVPAVTSGSVLNLTGQILTDANDETPHDNTFSLVQTVVNSFDPNDKTCLEGATIAPEMAGQYVHYQIRFENTGTFFAQNIVVKDMIDATKFDIASLVPIDGSHDFYTRINGNKVEFVFENINLPFWPEDNQGYVVFKIKTKPTLVLGDTFSNTASIYFDYNHPVVTEPAVTTIALLKTQDFGFSDHFSVHPNPATDVLNVQSKTGAAIQSVAVYNMLGQLMRSVVQPKQSETLDVSALPTGNYLIRIVSDKGLSAAKIIKK